MEAMQILLLEVQEMFLKQLPMHLLKFIQLNKVKISRIGFGSLF
jgi:hypothetical protein